MRTLGTTIGLLAATFLYAQDVAPVPAADHGRAHRISIGGGLGFAAGELMLDQYDWLSLVPPDQFAPREEHNFVWPAFYLQADVRVCDHLTLSVHYNHWQQEQWLKEGHDIRTSTYNSVNTYLAGGQWRWSGADQKLAVYSGLMLGPSFQHQTARGDHSEEFFQGDETHLAYQVTALGLRTGTKAGFVAELGKGYKGILSVGFYVRL